MKKNNEGNFRTFWFRYDSYEMREIEEKHYITPKENSKVVMYDPFDVADDILVDILMIGRPFQLGFMLFGTDAGLSFYWYARLVAMMLGSYELCLILTKRNKKVSLCGMIVITFSAAVQWWYCMQVLIWGQIVVVLVDKFMTTNKKRNKYKRKNN